MLGVLVGSSKRQLILGGGGFLGRHLARSLVRCGDRVTLLDRAFPEGMRRFPAKLLVMDLSTIDDAALAAIMSDYDIVYHLAWSSIPASAEADPAGDARENVGLLNRILTCARGLENRIVFASSGGTVYGRTGHRPVVETARLSPVSAYGAGKAAAELYAKSAAAVYGSDVRIARISNPYGAGQSHHRPQGALSRFVFDATLGRELEIWGDGRVVRDYIQVEDVAKCLRCLGMAERAALPHDAVINIGAGVGVSLNDLVDLIQELMPQPVRCRRLPAARRAFDVPRNVLDITRARKYLTWSPQIDLREGVARMIEDVMRDPLRLFSR